MTKHVSTNEFKSKQVRGGKINDSLESERHERLEE